MQIFYTYQIFTDTRCDKIMVMSTGASTFERGGTYKYNVFGSYEFLEHDYENNARYSSISIWGMSRYIYKTSTDWRVSITFKNSFFSLCRLNQRPKFYVRFLPANSFKLQVGLSSLFLINNDCESSTSPDFCPRTWKYMKENSSGIQQLTTDSEIIVECGNSKTYKLQTNKIII